MTKSALYSGTYIAVPTSGLASVANTELLLNFNTDFSDTSGLSNTVSTVGTPPTIQSGVTKFGSSAYFNNNGYIAVS